VLYEKYGPQMYSICLRYAGGNEDANDIFQQGFLLVYENLNQLRNTDALSGWVKRVFVNAALEHNRKAGHLSLIHNPEMKDEVESDNWNDAFSKMATDEITGIIQELPDRCRTVFNMFIIDGYSHKEIADRLSISTGTSKSQLFDARKILKNRINQLSRRATKIIEL
jgi:RNA polymerase sigma factor (sigma-70 family)